MSRLVTAYRVDGVEGIISKRRGRKPNNTLGNELREKTVELVRTKYWDFGPTLASEKLLEFHDIRISVEALRKWLIAADIWKTRKAKNERVYQPRLIRDCFGELDQAMAVFDKLPRQTTARKTILDRDQFRVELETVKNQGYAFDNEEWFDDMVGVSVPVKNDNGTLIACLSTHALVTRKSIEILRTEVPLMS